jgi:hypothetical protein
MIQDVKTSSLNYPHTDVDLLNGCKVIYGGVAWPGKQPGFAVIVAMLYEKHFDSYDIYLLEEFESFDTRELVRQCGAMDARYKPAMWIGDNRNDAADRFINEMASELQTHTMPAAARRSFCVSPTLMTEMNQLYAYMLPHLKRLLDPERRVLFLKDSKALSYLASIEENEVADLEFGAYPAIEALAFAVIEMRNHYPATRPDEGGGYGDDSTLADSYGWPKNAFG